MGIKSQELRISRVNVTSSLKGQTYFLVVLCLNQRTGEIFRRWIQLHALCYCLHILNGFRLDQQVKYKLDSESFYTIASLTIKIQYSLLSLKLL